jgi:hypothetical protein
MTEKSITTQEKKLKTLSRILWILFLGIAIPSIAFIWALYPLRLAGDFGSRSSEIMLLIGPFLMIAGLGVVCLVIYNIFKYRLEKEDDLFL